MTQGTKLVPALPPTTASYIRVVGYWLPSIFWNVKELASIQSWQRAYLHYYSCVSDKLFSGLQLPIVQSEFVWISLCYFWTLSRITHTDIHHKLSSRQLHVTHSNPPYHLTNGVQVTRPCVKCYLEPQARLSWPTDQKALHKYMPPQKLSDDTHDRMTAGYQIWKQIHPITNTCASFTLPSWCRNLGLSYKGWCSP